MDVSTYPVQELLKEIHRENLFSSFIQDTHNNE